MDLIAQIEKEHSVDNAIFIAEFIEENPENLKILVNIILSNDLVLSQRASWVLSKFSDDFYIELIPFLDQIFLNLQNSKHNSIFRNFARVFILLSSKRNIAKLSNKNIDDIIENSFIWLINDKVKVAIRVLSMYTLSNLANSRPWIEVELRIIIDNNIAGSLPSFRSASKKVLKSLNSKV